MRTQVWRHTLTLCQVVFLLAHHAVAQNQTVWLSASLAFNAVDYPVGFSSRVGGDIMLEEINAAGILPGYELKVLFQDDKCDAIEGSILFLRNIHEEKYYPIAPGTLTSTMLDSNDVNPPPVGMIGMGCSGPTQRGVLIAQYVNMPVVSGATSSSTLSNRTRFPNFFRTVTPDIPIGIGVLRLFIMLSITRCVAVSGTSLEWEEAAAGFISLMHATGITPVGPSTSFSGFNGALIPDNEEGVRGGIEVIKKQRTRVVGVVHNIATIRMMMCEAYRVRMFNTIYATVSSLEDKWWLETPNLEEYDCTEEMMLYSARGFLQARMVFWRNDDDKALSCSASMTARQFREEWFSRLGKTYGDMSTLPNGQLMSDNAASLADAVCLFALALRSLLISPGNFNVTDLAARTPAAYSSFNDALAATVFEGVTGRVLFPPFQFATSRMALGDPGTFAVITQLHADGSIVKIAEWIMVEGRFNFLGAGDLTFHFPGETAFAGPAGAGAISMSVQQFLACDRVLDYLSNTCGGCPFSDEVYVQATDTCVCLPGFYRVNTSECIPCAPGYFAGAPGTSECEKCAVGKSTGGNTTATECTNCEEGKYAGDRGMGVCTSCPARQTTLQINSKSANDCVCMRGTYNASAEGIMENYCKVCPSKAGTDAPAQTDISDCKCDVGYFMPTDTSHGCQECPTLMSCPNRGTALNNQANFPNLTAGYWASETDPLSIFDCANRNRCPGWKPGEACGYTGLQGQACERCELEHKWTGDRCVPCDPAQSNKFFFPVLPLLLLPCLILLLYKVFADTITKWGSWQNTVAALGFVVLNHYQVLGILSRANVEYPQALGNAIDVYMATNEVTAGFGLDCIGIVELFDLMVLKGAMPAVVLFVCFALYILSNVLAKLIQKDSVGLQRDRLFNVAGSLMFTFFGSIASMSMQLFKCKENPNGLDTLAVDLSIICGFNSKKWMEGLAVGITCVVLYVFGIGAVFVYAVATAPQRFKNAGFRMRWKFLFIKYHASAYWWGLMFLLKNFLINLAFVVSGRAESQLYICLSVVLLYILVLMEFFPFRATLPNLYELFIGACHILVFSLSVWYVQKLDNQESKGIEVAGLLVSFSPAAGVFWAVAYLAMYGKKARTPEIIAHAEDTYEQLKISFENFGRLHTEMGAHMVLSMDEGDLRVLQRAAFLINVDVFGAASNTRCAMDIRRWSVSPHRFTGISSTAMATRLSATMAIAEKEAMQENTPRLQPSEDSGPRYDSRESVRNRTGALTSV